MKGRFSLNKIHKYDSTYLMFGNLGHEHPEGYAIAIDQFSEHGNYATLIAHDVIEHPANHRTNTGVTVEAEIRALGSVAYTRAESDVIESDMRYQLGYASNRDLCEPPPIRVPDMGFATVPELRRICLEQNDIRVSGQQARKALAHLNYGYWQAEQRFGCQYRARNAFDFIKNNMQNWIDSHRYFMGDYESSGVSFYFDTEKRIFNTRYKHKQEFY